MFLNAFPTTEAECTTAQPVGLTMAESERLRKLKDYDVNYYGFICSQEYLDFHKSLEGEIRTADMYESPYFGYQSSGAYSELDRVYEAYRKRFVDSEKSTTSTINPALILAAAAAFFFAG